MPKKNSRSSPKETGGRLDWLLSNDRRYSARGGQASFAKEMGVSNPTVTNWLQGVHGMGTDNAMRAADKFGVSFEWFYLGRGEGPPGYVQQDGARRGAPDDPLAAAPSIEAELKHVRQALLAFFSMIAVERPPEGERIAQAMLAHDPEGLADQPGLVKELVEVLMPKPSSRRRAVRE